MPRSEGKIARVTRSKEEARAVYDRRSRWYDLLLGPFERKHRELALGKLGATEGEQVLEIGFGTGNCILALARVVGESGKIYGIDISEGMCRITQAKVHQAGLSDRVTLKCADAVRLPFEADFFDAIFMSFVLELFDTPEIPIVLGECWRALRAGGRISAVALSKKGRGGPILRLYEWAHRRFPRYVDCRPIFVREALAEAGFQVSEDTRLSLAGLPVEIVLARKT